MYILCTCTDCTYPTNCRSGATSLCVSPSRLAPCFGRHRARGVVMKAFGYLRAEGSSRVTNLNLSSCRPLGKKHPRGANLPVAACSEPPYYAQAVRGGKPTHESCSLSGGIFLDSRQCRRVRNAQFGVDGEPEQSPLLVFLLARSPTMHTACTAVTAVPPWITRPCQKGDVICFPPHDPRRCILPPLLHHAFPPHRICARDKGGALWRQHL